MIMLFINSPCSYVQLACITLNSAYNKKYAEISLHYRWLFVKDNIFIGKWEIFGAEVFLCYNKFFIKGDLIIDGVECNESQGKWI